MEATESIEKVTETIKEVTQTIGIVRSKKGIPCFWESGGGSSNTGEAIIIASPEGKKIKPIYIRRSGHLSNSDHALVPLTEGSYIIKTYHHRGDYTINIYKILSFDNNKYKATVKNINCFDNGEWDFPLEEKLVEPVEVSKNKSNDYHCRSAYFVDID